MNGTPPRTVSDLFPSKWLKAEDLDGRPHTVRIVDVTVESLRPGELMRRDPERESGLSTLRSSRCDNLTGRRSRPLS